MRYEIPSTQEEIPAAISKANREIVNAQRRLDVAVIWKYAIQDMCEHPESEFRNTWGRWPETICLICGASMMFACVLVAVVLGT